MFEPNENKEVIKNTELKLQALTLVIMLLGAIFTKLGYGVLATTCWIGAAVAAFCWVRWVKKDKNSAQ